ncbi:MAG: chloride channel protein [Acidimicrobiia bacterium]|nr:chloride channel protein [Acidimicrobiia bacterium]
MRPLTRTLRQARNPRLLAASAATGVIVALVVAAFETLALHIVLERVLEQPLAVLALAPVLGIAASKLVLRTVGGGTSGSTSDEYVRAFHERHPSIGFRFLPAKLLAGVATIGSGGAVGLEGPSLYAGSSIGLFVHERLGRFFRRDEARLLLTAGAAAGVAAVFKTPATGVIFALEAPYRDDVTPQALLPSLIASAASYVTFVFLVGSTPVVPFLGEGPVDANGAAAMLDVQIGDLLGALILGIAAGLGGRGFAWLVRQAKHATHTVSWAKRALAAAVVMAGLALLADVAFGEVLSLGPGTRAMEWVVQQDALELIALLFGVRVAATLATVLGDGVGGLFIPLATLGVIVGQFVGVALDATSTGLYATLGLAAFLGAGYRAPIAAVMFVAESTGAAAFVVPALVAAAVSQVVGGPSSVTEYQRSKRLGHLEQRFTLPLSSILTTDVLTVPPDATVSEFVYMHVLGRRERVVPVVEGSSYLGMAQLSQLSSVNRDQWETASVESMMTTDLPAGSPSWTVRDAVVAMEAADIEVLAVTDSAGNFIGVVTEDDVVRLGEILEETEG